MKKHLRCRHWLSFILFLLLFLAACGGGEGDEAVQESSDTDAETVDDTTDSEAVADEGIGATGSEEDSGGLPPTPDTGSKVSTTRTSTEAGLSADTAVSTSTPPANRTESQEQAVITQLDIVLVLDATGSMAEELTALQASLDTIAAQLSTLPNTTLRYGFIIYRDQAKTESTQLFNLTADWELFATNLRANVTAIGGNDYPEDLKQWSLPSCC